MYFFVDGWLSACMNAPGMSHVATSRDSMASITEVDPLIDECVQYRINNEVLVTCRSRRRLFLRPLL